MGGIGVVGLGTTATAEVQCRIRALGSTADHMYTLIIVTKFIESQHQPRLHCQANAATSRHHRDTPFAPLNRHQVPKTNKRSHDAVDQQSGHPATARKADAAGAAAAEAPHGKDTAQNTPFKTSQGILSFLSSSYKLQKAASAACASFCSTRHVLLSHKSPAVATLSTLTHHWHLLLCVQTAQPGRPRTLVTTRHLAAAPSSHSGRSEPQLGAGVSFASLPVSHQAISMAFQVLDKDEDGRISRCACD
jgi:hypothetical protein